jgi:CRISPR-associated protein Csm5
MLLWKLSQTPRWQEEYPELLETVLQARDERWAATPMVENAFNIATRRKRTNDANRDLMRVLHVSDAHFAAEDLELADTRIFNLSSEERYGWKNISKRRNEREPCEATQLAAEALRVGVAAAVTLTIDDFLLQSAAAQQEAAFGKYAEYFQTQVLPKICNDYAQRQIAKQRAFFAKYGLKPLVKFYDELEAIRAGLPASDFLLRLSWGSGWQGMTGELIENPEDLQRVRKKFGMGKMEMVGEMPEECPICHSKKIRPDNRKEDTGFCYEGMHSFPAPGVKKALFPIFPKTRKIALEAGRDPRYPFGWVRFCSEKPEIPPAEDRRQFAPPAFRQTASPAAQTPRPAAPPPPIPQPAPPRREPAIRPGEKILAQVIKHDGDNYTVRLLEKDPGRELNFTRAFIPVVTGDTVEVRVKSTNPAGDQVTKIDFVSKVKK